MIKAMSRLLLALALLATTSGCYAFQLGAQDLDKPVSMSETIGRPAVVERHFRHDMILTWYFVGTNPIGTLPAGPAGGGSPTSNLVRNLLEHELRDGDGIVNLRVAHGVTLPAFGLSVVAFLVPWVGVLTLWVIKPMGVTIEGDVVRLGAQGELPAGSPAAGGM